VAYGIVPVSGAGSPPLGEFVSDAVGTRGATGAASTGFGDQFVATGFGDWDPPSIQGAATTALGAFAATITGSQSIVGSVAALLAGDLVPLAVGSASLQGSSQAVLGNFQTSTLAFTTVFGVGTATMLAVPSEAYGYHPGPVVGFCVAILSDPGTDNPCQASGWVFAFGTVTNVVTGLNLGATLSLPTGAFSSIASGTFLLPYFGIGAASFPAMSGNGAGSVAVTTLPSEPVNIFLQNLVSGGVGIHIPVVFGTSGTQLLIGSFGGSFVGGGFGVFPYIGPAAPVLGNFVTETFAIAAVRGQAVDVLLGPLGAEILGIHAPAVIGLASPTIGNYTVTFSFGIAWVKGNTGQLDSPSPAELFGSFGQLASPRNFGRHIQPIFGDGAIAFPIEIATITPAWQVRYAKQGTDPIRGGDVVVGNTTKARGRVLSDFMFGTTGRLVMDEVVLGAFTYNQNQGPVAVPFIVNEQLYVDGELRGVVTASENTSVSPNSTQTQVGDTRHLTFQDSTIFFAQVSGIACIITDPIAQGPISVAGQFVGGGVGARGASGFMYNYSPNNLNLDNVVATAFGVVLSGVGNAFIAGEFTGQGQGRWDAPAVPSGEGAAILPMPTCAAFGITQNQSYAAAYLGNLLASGVGWAASFGVGGATIGGVFTGSGEAVFVHPLQIGCVACEVPGTPVFITGIFTFHFEESCIAVSPDVDVGGSFEVSCAQIYDACQRAQASPEGIAFDKIAAASGYINLTPDVQVALTVELLGSWHICFAGGLYQARVTGGNLTGGPGGPIAYSPGVQVVMVQAASALLVNGGFPSADDVATAVWSKPLPLP
jgi:hypothetical protein